MAISAWEWTADTTWAMWDAIGSMAAVVVGVAAAIFVVLQIRQARQLSEEQGRPYVAVWVEVDHETHSTLELHVKNIGLTAARNVTIGLNPPHEWTKPIGAESFMDARIFQRGLPTMPPQFEIVMAMDLVRHRTDAGKPPVETTATVMYMDRQGKSHTDDFVLDLDYLMGALRLDTHGTHHLASSVRAIAKKMGVTSF